MVRAELWLNVIGKKWNASKRKNPATSASHFATMMAHRGQSMAAEIVRMRVFLWLLPHHWRPFCMPTWLAQDTLLNSSIQARTIKKTVLYTGRGLLCKCSLRCWSSLSQNQFSSCEGAASHMKPPPSNSAKEDYRITPMIFLHSPFLLFSPCLLFLLFNLPQSSPCVSLTPANEEAPIYLHHLQHHIVATKNDVSQVTVSIWAHWMSIVLCSKLIRQNWYAL
jgi:hypothetical protein